MITHPRWTRADSRPDRAQPVLDVVAAVALMTLVGTALLLTVSLAPRPAAATTEASLDRLLALRAENRFEAALEMAESLLRAAPDNVDLLLVKGQLEAFLGDHAAALETLAAAAVLAPDYLDIRLMQARVQLFAEQPEAAFATLEPVVPPELERADAQLLLGRVALVAGELDTAERAFARAAELAPDNGDAWLGLGDAALETGSVSRAQLNFERALDVPDTAPVARQRLDALADAGRRFELTTDFSYSRFNNDFDNWREGSVALAWRIDDSRQLTSGIAIADRYDLTDLQVGVGWNARIDADSGYLLGAAVAPGADFLPAWLLRAGYDRRLYDLGDREIGLGLDLGAGIGFVEGSLAQYDDGLVQGFEAGIVQYALEGRTWLTAKAGGSFGTSGDFDPSFGLRLDVQARRQTRFFLGFGQAFDNSDQGTGTTRSYFGGVDHMLTDRVGLLATLALEDRDSGVRRTTFALGMRVRF